MATSSGSPRLSVTGAYMRVPASPDVAAVYLTIHDDGGAADTLVSVNTPDAASAQLHGEVRNGATESMKAAWTTAARPTRSDTPTPSRSP